MRTMVAQGEEARRGKRAKKRITVLIACSASGETLTLSNWEKCKPSLFQGSISMPASHILCQQKAWMTSDIFQQWPDKLNSKMKRKGCSIVSFVDKCSAHPDVVYSNVKLVLFPLNTTLLIVSYKSWYTMQDYLAGLC